MRDGYHNSHVFEKDLTTTGPVKTTPSWKIAAIQRPEHESGFHTHDHLHLPLSLAAAENKVASRNRHSQKPENRLSD